MGLFTFGLPKPKTQLQEALYLLIKRGGMTRKDFFTETYILNAPNLIMLLRRRGINIKTEEIARVNKYGRSISYGYYVLQERISAKDIYRKMHKK